MQYYGPVAGDRYVDDVEDEDEVKISDFLRTAKNKINYTYDFGDNWDHQVLLEKILPPDPSHQSVCTAGKRAAPLEDCGGIWGYMAMIESATNPADPRHQEMIEWLDEEGRWPLRTEECDLVAVNNRLSRFTSSYC
jgi:hypothetical protein